MDVSNNRGTPKSSILIGFSIINHPFWGTIILGNTHIYIYIHYYIFLYIYTYIYIYLPGLPKSPAKFNKNSSTVKKQRNDPPISKVQIQSMAAWRPSQDLINGHFALLGDIQVLQGKTAAAGVRLNRLEVSRPFSQPFFHISPWVNVEFWPTYLN